jgi:Ca2+-binding RTX toxin-like protein
LEERVVPAVTPFTTAQLREAYGIDQIKLGTTGVVGNGAGQTIALVVIGIDATLISDLQYYDQQLFGPGPDGAGLLDTFASYTGPVAGSPWFNIVEDPNFPPNAATTRQSLEAAIDVEGAHLVAPMANILVVETGSIQSGTAYAGTLQTTMPQLGIGVIASSSSHFPTFHPGDYADPNVTYVGITGDTGAPLYSQLDGYTGDDFPPASPLVIAVGGTTLTLNPDGSYGSETGWGFAGPNRFLTPDNAYLAPGYWTAVSGGFSGPYYTSPGPSGTTSTVWSTKVLASDTLGLNDSGLEISTTWTPSPSNADDVEYVVNVSDSEGNGISSSPPIFINQQLAPVGNAATLNSRTATFQELCALTGLQVGDNISIVEYAQSADGSAVVDAIGIGPDDASGGGLADSDQPQPAFQNGLVIHNGNTVISSGGTRAYPDVAFDGDYVNSPVEFYSQGAIKGSAGTSLGAPAWAGLIAIADQGLALAGQGPATTAAALVGLYNIPSSDFHDETSGYNGYLAGPGYDLVTGLGSPVANHLIPDLVNFIIAEEPPALISGPPTPAANVGTGYSFQFTASGFPAPTFSLLAGSTLPTGLTLSPSGLLSGTDTNPADAGMTFTGTVVASNGLGTDAMQAYSITVIQKASPTLTANAGDAVVLGTGVDLTATATLAGGNAETGNITFTLYGPTNTIVDTETATVTGNGTYATPHGFLPSVSGTYQWVASYGGDANNYGASTSEGSAPEVAVGPGATVVGNSLYLVGGKTNDLLEIEPNGPSKTGSTGIEVVGQLGNVHIPNFAFTQAFATIYVTGFGGNDIILFADTLTIATFINEADGNDTISLGNGNSRMQLGNGNNIVIAGNGTDKVQIGGGDNLVTVGSGNDTFQLGNGSNIVIAGNGNDTVQLGNGTNLVTLGNGNDTVTAGTGTDFIYAGDGTDAVTAGAIGSSGTIHVQLGNGAGDQVTLLGNGMDQVLLGNGNNDSISVTGNGNDQIVMGNGSNDFISLVGNGNETAQTGNGTGKLHLAGTGKRNLHLGIGWSQI